MINIDNRWINQGTGEIKDDVVNIETKQDVTQKQQKQQNQKEGYKYIQQQIVPLPSFLQQQFGNFIHSRYDALLQKTNYDTATAFRFIYLCTFMEYDTGYILWNNKHITDHYLIDIFGVHKNTITNIKKKLFDAELIFEDNDGHLYVNIDYCYRGDISSNKQYRQQCTRIFNDGIQKLYKNTLDFRDHKMLGKLILLLPYINIYHNVICLNTKEKDWDKLVIPNAEQMDSILHTSLRNNQKQMKKLLEIEINGEPAVLVVKHKNTHMYAVNPRIYYGGTKLGDVEELSGMFKVKGGLE